MRPMIPMQAGPEVIASRCEVASASRQNTFHQLATMAISRAIVRQLFSFCVANPDPHFYRGQTPGWMQFLVSIVLLVSRK